MILPAKILLTGAAALLLAQPACGATQAVAVIDDGYANKVLRKIMDTGKLKVSRAMEIRLSLDDAGHLLECRGSAGGDATAACAAAKAASPFGTPPYGLPTYVTIALWGGQTAAAAPKAAKQAQANAAPAGPGASQKAAPQAAASRSAYLNKIRRELRNSIYIPEKTRPGSYQATARIKLDSQGKILESSIIKGSGDSLLDKYVLQGIHRADSVTPPPADLEEPIDITFKLARRAPAQASQ